MKHLFALIFLSSCSTGGLVRWKNGEPIGILPTAMLGKQNFGKFRQKIQSPNGYLVETEIENYSTENPDPELVKGAVSSFAAKMVADTTQLGLREAGKTTRRIDDNAVKINSSDNSTEVAKTKILNPPPTE